MKAKKIIVAVVVVLLSLAIALLPVISSFAEDDHGADAHSPSMSTEERVIEKPQEDIEKVPQVDEKSNEEKEAEDITSNAEVETDVEEPSFFEEHEVYFVVGIPVGLLCIALGIVNASIKRKNKKSERKHHSKH